MKGFTPQKNFIKQNLEGFTLIELLIYIAILAGLLILITGFLWSVVFGNIKESSFQEVQQNGRFVMAKITEEIKKANGVIYPSQGNFDNYLSLSMQDTNLSPTIVNVLDGKLIITKGSLGPYELTTDRVIVSSLSFANLSYPDTQETIKIDLQVDHFNPGGNPQYQASVNFSSTVSLIPGGAPPAYCQNSIFSCADFVNQADCQSRDCTWTDPFCGGTCTPCEGLNSGQCRRQDGCSWDSQQRQCTGTCTTCDNFVNQSSCQDQSGCQWNPAQCAGVPTPCENYIIESECLEHSGCQWILP